MVGLLPTLLALSTLVFLLAADAPRTPLGWELILATAKEVGLSGGVAITALAVALSVSLQPLQFRLVQLLEGYWPGGHTGPVYRAGIRIQRWRLNRLTGKLSIEVPKEQVLRHAAAVASAADAEERLRVRFPKDESRLLPTSLGNALRAFEDRAGARYGLESAVVVWPRLYPLLPKEFRASIEDEVTQLDVSTRLCVTWASTAAISLVILLSDPAALMANWSWLIIVGGLGLLSALSYQSAVESALGHGEDVEVAVDLYRSKLIEAMRVRPANLLSLESDQLNTLERLFQTYEPDHDIELRFASQSLARPVPRSGGRRSRSS